MKKSKILLLILCAVLLVCVSVLGTVAFLTDSEDVVNTFTVGHVDLRLDEAVVDENGKPTGGRTEEGNQYHLIPGKTYTKDPTVTVAKGSEESYVRMLVTVNCMKEFDAVYAPEVADLTAIFNGYDASNWIYETVVRDEATNSVTYEFRYKETVKPSDDDTVLDALFDSITVPTQFDSDDMESLADLKITVVAHAIQVSGFDDADSAWTAFDAQIGK